MDQQYFSKKETLRSLRSSEHQRVVCVQKEVTFLGELEFVRAMLESGTWVKWLVALDRLGSDGSCGPTGILTYVLGWPDLLGLFCLNALKNF